MFCDENDDSSSCGRSSHSNHHSSNALSASSWFVDDEEDDIPAAASLATTTAASSSSPIKRRKLKLSPASQILSQLDLLDGEDSDVRLVMHNPPATAAAITATSAVVPQKQNHKKRSRLGILLNKPQQQPQQQQQQQQQQEGQDCVDKNAAVCNDSDDETALSSSTRGTLTESHPNHPNESFRLVSIYSSSKFLGMKIKRVDITAITLKRQDDKKTNTILHAKDTLSSSSSSSPCFGIQVQSISKDSIADLHGIQRGDILFVQDKNDNDNAAVAANTKTLLDHPCDTSIIGNNNNTKSIHTMTFTARNKHWIPATSYQEIFHLLESNTRPIWIGILSQQEEQGQGQGREQEGKVKGDYQQDHPPAIMTDITTTTTTSVALDPLVTQLLEQMDIASIRSALQGNNNNMMMMKKKGSNMSSGSFPTILFCKKCIYENDKNTTTSTTTLKPFSITHHHYHHPWCPHHTQFHTSGAKERLILIMSGVLEHCPACIYEYYYGRVPNSCHNGSSKTSILPWIHHELCGRENNNPNQLQASVVGGEGGGAKTESQDHPVNTKNITTSGTNTPNISQQSLIHTTSKKRTCTSSKAINTNPTTNVTIMNNNNNTLLDSTLSSCTTSTNIDYTKGASIGCKKCIDLLKGLLRRGSHVASCPLYLGRWKKKNTNIVQEEEEEKDMRKKGKRRLGKDDSHYDDSDDDQNEYKTVSSNQVPSLSSTTSRKLTFQNIHPSVGVSDQKHVSYSQDDNEAQDNAKPSERIFKKQVKMMDSSSSCLNDSNKKSMGILKKTKFNNDCGMMANHTEDDTKEASIVHHKSLSSKNKEINTQSSSISSTRTVTPIPHLTHNRNHHPTSINVHKNTTTTMHPSTSRREISSSIQPQHVSTERNVPMNMGDLNKTAMEDVATVSKWVKCNNPWGIQGYQEGDLMLLGPNDFNRHFRIYGDVYNSEDRFAMNPFQQEYDRLTLDYSICDYTKTHVHPFYGGTHTIRLVRDRMGQRNWGFTVERHDFGGACLVSSVETLSPAEAAVIVGCPELNAGLRINDMILLINGKSVGGMTLFDLSIETDLSGNELVLVLARYKQEETYTQSSQPSHDVRFHSSVVLDQAKTVERENGNVPANNNVYTSALHWIDISPATHINSTMNSDWILAQPVKNGTLGMNGDGVSNDSIKQPCHDISSGFTSSVEDKISATIDKKQEKWNGISVTTISSSCTDESNGYLGPVINAIKSNEKYTVSDFQENQCQITLRDLKGLSSCNQSVTDDDEWDGDENPWLGCICGRTHGKRTSKNSSGLFWIQCDDCQSWYECRKDCIGFDEAEALKLNSWICPACVYPGVEESESDKLPIIKSTEQKIMGERINQNYLQESELQILPVGTIVNVTNRTWAGSNKPGGVAKILQSRLSANNGDIMYDVKYVLGGRESNVSYEYVRIHEEFNE